MKRMIQRVALAGAASAFAFAASAAERDPQQGLGQLDASRVTNNDGGAPVLSDFEVRTAGAHFFKRVITSRIPRTTSTTQFAPLTGATTKIMVPARSTVLVNASFDAETSCVDFNEVNGLGWCEVRINIGGVEGEPAASFDFGDTFALDSTDGGTEGVGSWEGHAVSRHRCIANESTQPREIEVSLDWKLTNFPPAANGVFRIDDYSFVVEMARGCRVEQVNGGVPASPTTGSEGSVSN